MKKHEVVKLASFLPVLFTALLLHGCSAKNGSRLPHIGERLAVHYTCRLADNSVAATTQEEIGSDEKVPKAEVFAPSRRYRPALITVPEIPFQVEIDYFGSFEQKINQHLAQKASRLPLNKKIDLNLTSSVPKNIPDKERYLQMALAYSIPRRSEVPMDRFHEQIKEDPKPGMTLHGDDTFITAVESVQGETVTLYYTAKPGAKSKNDYGTEHFTNKDEKTIDVQLEVENGRILRTGPLVGKIIDVKDDHFTIDYGHPFGFETLSCQVEAVPVKDLADISGNVPWINNYDQAVTQSQHQQKPLFIIFYADWCDWCHKMFTEVFQDEQLSALQGSFVWLRLNSDVQEQFKKQFDQKIFPTLVVLDAKGKELKRFEGFRNATDLKRELESIVNALGKS